jgi:2-aminoethylphosphonate-pyruvate transaminase
VANFQDENPYLLLTPGPLSTSPTVRRAMLRDWCTWDDDYNQGIVQVVRQKLVQLATQRPVAADKYSAVLMQGSGTFSVEATVGTAIPKDGRLLVLANGAYGRRIAQIARVLGIDHGLLDSGELLPPDLDRVRGQLRADSRITHVAMVHGETTTGMLNPIAEIGGIVREEGKVFMVDAMSTFGGIPIDMDAWGIDWLISSANKCIQGVPGFGFVVATREQLASCQGQARSLSLDLYDQWKTMEQGKGKWRFTSPTHTVRAFAQALVELDEEGGILQRNSRFVENQRLLWEGMRDLGFESLLPRPLQSPIITAFRDPVHPNYCFTTFYQRLKARGFVIYPGKVTDVATFRIGTIGHVFAEDIRRLLLAVRESIDWNQK